MTNDLQTSLELLVRNALAELCTNAYVLAKARYPNVKLERMKQFTWIRRKFTWPHFDAKKVWCPGVVTQTSCPPYGTSPVSRVYTSTDLRACLAIALCAECGYQPRKVQHMLIQIRATSDWCTKRAAGLDRAAQNILQQQTKALNSLQTDLAMLALQNIGES